MPMTSTPLQDNLHILLVANKTDIDQSEWQVSMNEIIEKSKTLNCHFILTSAVNMSNFKDLRNYLKLTYINSGDIEAVPISNSGSYCSYPCSS